MVQDIEVIDLMNSVEKFWKSIEDDTIAGKIDYYLQDRLTEVLESLLMQIWTIKTRRWGEPDGERERKLARGRIQADIERRWRAIRRQQVIEEENSD